MQQQKQTLSQLSSSIPSLRKLLSTEISDLNNSCLEAKVEENDYTVLTVDDLEYELELAEVGLKKKIAFIDNQVSRFWRQVKIMLMTLQLVSAQHTNITPAKLEEFEATFKHFAWEETNVSDVPSSWKVADEECGRLSGCGRCIQPWRV